MDLIVVFNGLGNQMSQYALYLNKKEISGNTGFLFSKKSRSVHNGYELDKVFGISYVDSLKNKILYFIYKIASYKKFPVISVPIVAALKMLGIEVIYENDDYNFKSEYLKPSAGLKYYVGGWHSEKYFIDIEDKVLATFQFNNQKIDAENRKVMNAIKSVNSVSVHVRRGDFMDANNLGKLGGVCTLNYYLKAIEKMRSLVKNPHFFFFTNDVPWVREHFINSDFTIIDLNRNEDSWKDMFLISNCSHHINSNGSFSWWSSWLNKKNNPYVIVPKNFTVGRYFDDIYPENWIKLADY